MDHLIQETDKNREMFNLIAHKAFATNGPDQGMLPTGQKVSQKYIFTSLKIFIFIFFS